jgi:dihydrofolate synthase / folylpolyglutamate synthase
MKNIPEYFKYLYSLERTGMKYDLENIIALLKNLGNPHNNFQSIHIAGTNGKGATASFINSILMGHGLKTGLFTSPHIIKFNERIRVNGKKIPDSYIIDFLDRNKKIIKKIKPSFFEVSTAMAFEYFSKKKIDIAVVECGLGGRLDSTNILHPEISMITQIGMDHMQYLGNTLKKIAMEKIGIVKQGVDVIVSDNNKSLKKLFKNKIDKEFLYYLDDILKVNTNDSGKFDYTIPLPGDFQLRNAAAAILAIEKYLNDIGIKPVYSKIHKGLTNVMLNSGYRCRLELVKNKNKELIFDISHNPDGLKQTVLALKNYKPDAVIFGIMEDKKLKDALNEVLKISKNIILTKADYKRSAVPEYLAGLIKSKRHKIILTESVIDAINKVLDGNKHKRILITGSFFVISDAIKALNLQKYFN